MRQWKLVGRDDQLASVASSLQQRGRGVLLAGMAGVGKTRLAIECLQLASDADYATQRIAATQATASVPFGVLASVLPHAEHTAPATANSQRMLLQHYARALIESAGGRRLALMVDDAQLLDLSSAALVHQLATSGSVYVLATVRTGQPAPSPITALWKDGLVDRIELNPLSVPALEKLLTSVLEGPVDRATAARLAGRSQGNMLFLRELVIGAFDDGSLCQKGGVWQLTGLLNPSLRLSELISDRLGALEPAERELLEVVAVGEPVGPAELSIASQPALLDALEQKQLVVSRLDGLRLTLSLAHPLYGDVLRSQIPALRMRTLARALAEAVESTGARRREDVLRIATWRLAGGGGAPDLMLSAAHIARWRFDFPLAQRLARAAIAAGAAFEAELLSAQLLALRGSGEEAESKFKLLAASATTDSERGLVAVNRLDNAFFHRAQLNNGLRIADVADSEITDPSWREEIAARRTGFLLATKSFGACADAARPLLKTARGRALVWTAWSGAYGLGRLGRLGEAVAAADAGFGAHRGLTSPSEWDPAIHISVRCDALAYEGRFELANSEAMALYEQALLDGNSDAQAYAGWHLGKMVRERGHVDSAVRFEREAAGLFQRLGRPMQVEICLTYEAMALAIGGQGEQAAKVLQDLAALELPRTNYVRVDQLEAHAWTAVAHGKLREAVHYLREGISLADEISDFVGKASALHTLGRLGHGAEALDRMTEVATRIEGELMRARLRHVRALVEADAEVLQNVSGRFAAMGATLLAAEAAADAAVAWRARGVNRNSVAAERHAYTLMRICEGAITPALTAIEHRGMLTDAERHIATLAAAGHSNKQIADQLSRSVRTVENRLQRIYEKLGVSSRQELTEVLHP